MSPDPTFDRLGDERFICLTTFRRSGEPVSTPVWVARDGDALVVTTPAGSGKVKRLRNDPRVQIRPCSRFGRVDDSARPVAGVATVLTDEDSRSRLTSAIRRKYGLEFRIFSGIEGLRRSGRQPRVILRITRD